MADTNFEIYYRNKGSDRWMMDSRYGTTSKQEALDDAKELEREPNIDAVRVVREIHNAENNTTRDTVIYTSSKLKKEGGGGCKRRDDDDGLSASRSPASRPSPAARDYGSPDDVEEEAPKKSWFKRALKEGESASASAGADGADGAPTKVSGARAYMVVVKFIFIVFISFFIATATTYVYTTFLA